jgi:hypothetical protein
MGEYENLLESTIIYGTVFDTKIQKEVAGAEVSIAGSSSQTGITEILVKSARGRWYHSNHYLNP